MVIKHEMFLQYPICYLIMLHFETKQLVHNIWAMLNKQFINIMPLTALLFALHYAVHK